MFVNASGQDYAIRGNALQSQTLEIQTMGKARKKIDQAFLDKSLDRRKPKGGYFFQIH